MVLLRTGNLSKTADTCSSPQQLTACNKTSCGHKSAKERCMAELCLLLALSMICWQHSRSRMHSSAAILMTYSKQRGALLPAVTSHLRAWAP